MCRDAYQFVAMISDYTAAQSMFTQINEYAALAGPDYSWEAIKDHVVGKDLCGANSTSKSGMALVGDWQTTKVSTSEFEFEFCATATHYPSIFRIYITDYNFNVKTDELSWDRLSLVSEHINPLPVDAVSFLCTSPTAYRFPITLPYRRQGIIYVWWQRQDAAGEGFYNCVDFTMNLFKD